MADVYEKLMETVKTYGKQLDTERVEKAYRVAEHAHEKQLRASGEPYIIHPVEAACITVRLGMDTDTVVTALLHDVVEDTDVSLDEISKEFGKDVALMVDGVTKLGKIQFVSREEQQAENVRKMLLAMAQDVRVIIVKLADRLHNARTFCYLSEEKKRRKALETMEIYAPLAHRLGIRPLKEELEDICIKILDPIGYEGIEQRMSLQRDTRVAFLDLIKERIRKRLDEEKQPAHIEGRIKSVYSIYRKVYQQNRSIEEIFDIYAVRVIVDTVYDCYNVMGIMHDMFRPIPDRFKDYISTPKQNMYQSLHTTCIDKEGIPFEIQIRTWDMHHTAEYGIAAHWKYKAGLSGKDRLDERLAWVRQLLEQQQDLDDVEDIVRSIKTDLSPDEVFVFTPKGDVINLPTGSTIVDFAYAIHTAVGNKMTGAKVNGRIVPLDYVVKTGTIVEIITTNAVGHGPSRDWLKIAKTSGAKTKIRGWFKKEKRDENIIEGKAELEREFRRNLMILEEPDYSQFLEEIARRQHCATVDDFYASIGYGGITLSKIMPWAKEEFTHRYRAMPAEALVKQSRPSNSKANGGVIIEGLDSCLVKFAKCCNPLPGDEIIGFITRGSGVSIHKADCNTARLAVMDESQKGRWINAWWADTIKDTYKSVINIVGEDRQGLLADVSITLANLHIPMHSLNARELGDNKAGIQVTTEFSGIDQLRSIMDAIRRVRGVITVERG